MLNIEKYEDEIKAKVKNGTSLECAIHDIRDVCSCGEPFRCTDCQLKSLDWILQEYKEPILSQEGIEFLKQLIAPFISNKFVSIGINKDLETLRINYEIGWVSYPKKVLREKWDWFKKLNPEKLYTLEDLGLWHWFIN